VAWREGSGSPVAARGKPRVTTRAREPQKARAESQAPRPPREIGDLQEGEK